MKFKQLTGNTLVFIFTSLFLISSQTLEAKKKDDNKEDQSKLKSSTFSGL